MRKKASAKEAFFDCKTWIDKPALFCGIIIIRFAFVASFVRSGAAAVRMVVGVSLCQRRAKGASGPLVLGAPIRLPGVPPCAPWGPGAPSAHASHPVCRPGPAHFGRSADPPTLFSGLRCLSRRLRRATARRFISAAMPQ